MNREEAKENVSRWLSQEGENQWKVQPNGNDPRYYFTWNVELAGIPAVICIEKKVDRVDIIGNIMLEEDDMTAYKLTPDRQRFWTNLKMHTFPIGVMVNAIPNSDQLETIQFAKMIYFDALTQDNLMNTLIRIFDAMEIGEFVFRRFIESLEERRRDS
jgi:hypothetical protein